MPDFAQIMIKFIKTSFQCVLHVAVTLPFGNNVSNGGGRWEVSRFSIYLINSDRNEKQPNDQRNKTSFKLSYLHLPYCPALGNFSIFPVLGQMFLLVVYMT